MSDPGSLNIYSPEDLADGAVPAAERVFISHRRADKPLAEAVAAIFQLAGQPPGTVFDESLMRQIRQFAGP